MKVYFLGTNGWFDSETGETTCLLIDADEGYLILDAGNAFRKIDRYLTNPAKPIYLFLSHFHLDHTYGLHILPKFRLPQGLTLIGQRGTKKQLKQILASPWSCPIAKLPYPVTVQEVGEGVHQDPLPFTCRFLVHADPCLGYRFTLEGKTITFCTDTGVCDNLVRLATNADLLITECTWREQNEFTGWPHLAPEDGAHVAQQARAKQLALMHFDGYRYAASADRTDAERRARAIFSATRAMRDDEMIEV